MDHQNLTLPDGRTLEYVVSGSQNDDAFTLLCFHGTVGSSIPNAQMSAACAQRNIRLITPSRPGYGGSTRHAGRKVVDVVADMEALLGDLGAERCVVVGHSGGGPHALACAARLKACVAAVTIAGAAPTDAKGLDYAAGQAESNLDEWTAMQQGEPALRTLCTREAADMLASDAKGISHALASMFPPVDKEALLADNAAMAQYIFDQIQHGLRGGQIDGWVDDDLELMQGWGFDLSTEVRVPVHVYQGTEDMMVPFAHGKWIAENLPGEWVTKRLIEGEGHVSIWMKSLGEVLDLVVTEAKKGGS